MLKRTLPLTDVSTDAAGNYKKRHVNAAVFEEAESSGLGGGSRDSSVVTGGTESYSQNVQLEEHTSIGGRRYEEDRSSIRGGVVKVVTTSETGNFVVHLQGSSGDSNKPEGEQTASGFISAPTSIGRDDNFRDRRALATSQNSSRKSSTEDGRTGGISAANTSMEVSDRQPLTAGVTGGSAGVTGVSAGVTGYSVSDKETSYLSVEVEEKTSSSLQGNRILERALALVGIRGNVSERGSTPSSEVLEKEIAEDTSHCKDGGSSHGVDHETRGNWKEDEVAVDENVSGDALEMELAIASIGGDVLPRRGGSRQHSSSSTDGHKSPTNYERRPDVMKEQSFDDTNCDVSETKESREEQCKAESVTAVDYLVCNGDEVYPSSNSAANSLKHQNHIVEYKEVNVDNHSNSDMGKQSYVIPGDVVAVAGGGRSDVSVVNHLESSTAN